MSSGVKIEDELQSLRKAFSVLIRVSGELRKRHKEIVNETIKKDRSGFTTAYTFIYLYAVEGVWRRSFLGEAEPDPISCTEIEKRVDESGGMVKFLVKVPSKTISISVAHDLCPAPASPHGLEIHAVPIKDKEKEVKGGHIAFIPLGVLRFVEIKYKDKVELRLEPRKIWELPNIDLKFMDVEETIITVKNMIGIGPDLERNYDGPKLIVKTPGGSLMVVTVVSIEMR